MGFYGNITNTSNTTFQFDRIYPNRLNMDSSVNNDGIFIGRYVLVEYQQSAAYPVVYIKDDQFYSSPNCEEITRIKFLQGDRKDNTDENNDGYFDGIYQGEFVQTQQIGEDKTTIKFYQCIGNDGEYAAFIEATSDTSKSNYITNFGIDEYHYSNEKGFKGYDSTVWVKTSITTNDGKLITKYVNIADLNSVVPTFDIAADAPTMNPITPHFDADSTNVYYKLHMQSPYGFRVAASEGKSDEQITWTTTSYDKATDTTTTVTTETFDGDIYYNKAGFDPEVVSKVTGDNYIKLAPTAKSGAIYSHGQEENDIQEFRLHLPAIGNMMSDAWDIIHGKQRNDYRGDGENSSLQGRLDAFQDICANQIAVKSSDEDGTIVGSKINNGEKYIHEGDILDKRLNIEDEGLLNNDDPWIRTYINTADLVHSTYQGDSGLSQEDNNGIAIQHTFHATADSETSLDKNSGEAQVSERQEKYIHAIKDSNGNVIKTPINAEVGNKTDEIKLYTPYVDATGHVVGKNIETITLPYGYKTIKAAIQSTAVTDPSTNTIEVIADSTQDTLQFASSNKWIKMSGTNKGKNINYDTFSIGHEVHPIDETVSNQGDNETSHTNANKESGAENEINLTMYDWTYDEAGHITSKRQHTYTLPYGFKTINVGNDTTESAAPAQTGVVGETADHTQDSLTFTPTNKWIKMVATGNDEIKFGHELSGIEAKEHSSSDTDIENFGDTFNILKFTTDKAGHITTVGEESIKIPSIAFTNDTTGNVVTNMNFSYNTNNKTGTFTETRENIGTLTLGTHTGTTITTNGLNILNTDTVSGAFNKVQTHINSLNLASTNSDLEWVTDVTQANGQIAIARKGTDNLKLNSYNALTSVSSIDLATNDTLNNAFGKLEYRIKEEEKNRVAAINALDIEDTIDNTKYVSGVSETDGKITVSRAGTDTLKLSSYSIASISSDVANGDTINSAFGKIQKQIKDIYGNEEIATNFDTIKEIADWLVANDSDADKIIDSITTLNGNDTVSGSVANSIKNAIEGLDSSKTADTNKYISGITITNGKISNIAQTTLPIRTVTSGTTNGTILVNGSAINVGGLKSAAYTESAAYATAAQGVTAEGVANTIATYGDIVKYNTNDFVSKEEYNALLEDYNALKALVDQLNKQINPESGE